MVFNRNKREPEIHDPADLKGFFDDDVSGIDVRDAYAYEDEDDQMEFKYKSAPDNNNNSNNNEEEYEYVEEEPPLQDDSAEMNYDDVRNNAETKRLYPPENEYTDEEDDFYSDDELRSSPEAYANNPMQKQSSNAIMHQYQNINSEEQFYDVISGVNDVPMRYRDDNYIPELVMPSLQYNLIRGQIEKAEWQVKARCLIRKHQMNNPDFKLNGRDVAGITYINDLLLTRATDGFERKMSIQNIQGTLEELNTEAAPAVSQPKKKGILGGLFS